MKQLTKIPVVSSVLTLLCLVVFQAALIAQDAQPGGSSSTTTVTKQTTTYWYANPWVWVIGAAVFILLLVALLKGRNSSSTSDRVSVTKTVSRDV